MAFFIYLKNRERRASLVMLHFLLEKTGDQHKTVLITMAAMAAMACDHDVGTRLFEVGMVIPK